MEDHSLSNKINFKDNILGFILLGHYWSWFLLSADLEI